MKNVDIVKNKIKFLLIPAVIILVGIIMYFVNSGFNYDIEFIGGVKMEIAMDGAKNTEEIKAFLESETGISPIVVQTTEQGISIKTKAIEEKAKADKKAEDEATEASSVLNQAKDENAGKIFEALKTKYNLTDEALLSESSASASFGKQVQGKAFLFTAIAVLLILLYIAIRFEWRSAVMSVIALLINILVMMAVYAITYTPLNTTFIAAMLTVVGYSINNTIVVFDRIRENMKLRNPKRGITVSTVVNTSIWESMGRTINTTITTLITIVLLYVLGVTSVKEFAFPLIIGVIAGAYSSIFIASTFWASWKESAEEAKKIKK